MLRSLNALSSVVKSRHTQSDNHRNLHAMSTHPSTSLWRHRFPEQKQSGRSRDIRFVLLQIADSIPPSTTIYVADQPIPRKGTFKYMKTNLIPSRLTLHVVQFAIEYLKLFYKILSLASEKNQVWIKAYLALLSRSFHSLNVRYYVAVEPTIFNFGVQTLKKLQSTKNYTFLHGYLLSMWLLHHKVQSGNNAVTVQSAQFTMQ
jgi:hypothetical protein